MTESVAPPSTSTARPNLLRVRSHQGARVPVSITADATLSSPRVAVSGMHSGITADAIFGESRVPQIVARDLPGLDVQQRPGDLPARPGSYISEIEIPASPDDARPEDVGRIDVRVPVGTRLDVQLDQSNVELSGLFDQRSSVHSEAGDIVGRSLNVTGPGTQANAYGRAMHLRQVDHVNALARAGTMKAELVGGDSVLTTHTGGSTSGTSTAATLNCPAEGHITYTRPTSQHAREAPHVNASAANVTVRQPEHPGRGSAATRSMRRHDRHPPADSRQPEGR